MNFQFTPLTETPTISVPFLEDARADFAPYYTTDKTPEKVQAEIVVELGKLGGYGVFFQLGTFSEKPKRYGYVVNFQYNGSAGMIKVAGLPMKVEDPKKRQRVLAQALSIVRDWIKAQVTAKIFMPGTEPLVQFLLVEGERTVTDFVIQSGRLPTAKQLAAGTVVEAKAELVE